MAPTASSTVPDLCQELIGPVGKWMDGWIDEWVGGWMVFFKELQVKENL